MQDTLAEIDLAIASIAAHQNVATHRLLVKVREFDELRGWEARGFLSCAHYLEFRISLSLGAAREHVRVARALAKLPAIDAAMASGALSYSKARALTRIAEPANEASLLETARELSAAGVERFV